MTEILFKELSYAVVGAAMDVHRVLGAGFTEVVYQLAFARELDLREIPYEREKPLRVSYKDIEVGYYVADFLVDNCMILELKSASALTEAHVVQAMNYLAATGMRLAILLNFGTSQLQQKRVIR